MRTRAGRYGWLLRQFVRQIWFRAAVISVLSVVLAVGIGLFAHSLPYDFGDDIGQSSVGTILQIMAASMLAVTTFSLTAMVSAYGAATQLATPRATQLLVSDPASQNALSTFLGAFVFAIVGIIGLQGSAYGSAGRAVLFGATVLVVLLVVVTLLRWIGHIAAFGRMADVIDRVEAAAARAMADHAADPHLGGRPAVAIPAAATALCGDRVGYVTHIDVAALARVAAAARLTVHVTALAGTMVHPARALLWVEGDPSEECRRALCDAFIVERHRAFDQDPRLGVIALAEIASRALSPATNDPGTAIEVLNAMLRVFLILRDRDEAAVGGDDDCGGRVYVGRPSDTDLLLDAFRPIVRDGGDEIEVVVRLWGTLDAIAAGVPALRAPLTELRPVWAARLARNLSDPDDRAEFAALADAA